MFSPGRPLRLKQGQRLTPRLMRVPSTNDGRPSICGQPGQSCRRTATGVRHSSSNTSCTVDGVRPQDQPSLSLSLSLSLSWEPGSADTSPFIYLSDFHSGTIWWFFWGGVSCFVHHCRRSYTQETRSARPTPAIQSAMQWAGGAERGRPSSRPIKDVRIVTRGCIRNPLFANRKL